MKTFKWRGSTFKVKESNRFCFDCFFCNRACPPDSVFPCANKNVIAVRVQTRKETQQKINSLAGKLLCWATAVQCECDPVEVAKEANRYGRSQLKRYGVTEPLLTPEDCLRVATKLVKGKK